LTGFLLASVAFQRAKQLQMGARPRVEAAGHKPTRVALLEILADAVSWTTDV
jgi:DNA-directed RNA polymerase omega subunit